MKIIRNLYLYSKCLSFTCFVIIISVLTNSWAEENEILLGYVTDLSGDNAFFANQEVVASKLAIEDLKKEGVNLRVIFEDSQNKPMQGLSAVQKLINLDKVDAIFVDFSPIITATIDTIKKANKLVLYSAAARSPLKTYEHAFKTYMDYSDGCRMVASELKKMGKKIAYLKSEIEAGELCETGIAIETKDFYSQVYQLDAQPRTQVLQIKAKGYDTILTAAYPAPLINIIKAAQGISFRPMIVESDYSLNPSVRSEFKDFLEGSLAYGIKSNHPKEYDERHLALLEDKSRGVIPYAAMDYVHIKQIARAVKACSKDDVLCQASNLNKAPAEPDFGFLGWEDRRAKVSLVLRKIVNGELVE